MVVRRYIDFLINLSLLLLYMFFFAAASLLFVHFFKCFSFLFQYFFLIKFCVLNNVFAQYKHTYGRLRASHGSHMKAAHNVLYTKKHIQMYASWKSAVLHQGAWCRSRSRGRALYRDASRAAYVLGPPPSRGGDLDLEGGVNVS